MKTNNIKIGIDIGGVIIAQDTDEPDLFFSNSFLNAKPFSHSFETIQSLVHKFSSDNIFIISKCGEKVQKKTREWLNHKEFFSFTGFNPSNLHFCLERHEKAGIAQELNLTHFIDDRYTVLKHLLSNPDIIRLFLFCPNEAEMDAFKKNPSDKIEIILDWKQIEERFK